MIEIPKADKGKIGSDYNLKPRKGKPLSGSGSVNTLESGFFDELLKAETTDNIDASDLELDQLIADLDRQGKAFVDNPVMDELVKYKSLVRGFLKKTGTAFKIAERKGPLRGLEQKIYKSVTVIDAKLEELTFVILQKEGDRLKLLSRLDEIKGLLLDLMH